MEPNFPRPRNPQLKEKPSGEGRQGAKRGTGKGRVWALPRPLCWAPQPCLASVLLLECLTICTPSYQVTGCLQELEGWLRALTEACTLRQERCEGNWGLQKLREQLDWAEAWLASREGLLLDPNCGVSPGPAH